MNCPTCKTSGLEATVLPTGESESGLTARQCPTCQGHWVAGDVYLQWVQTQPRSAKREQPASQETPATSAAVIKARLCPVCGRLLTRAKVGHGLSIQLDRCGTCAGFWFEAGEWAAMLAAGMHVEAHHVFSDAWQAEVLRQDRKAQHQRLMISKLGEADWREIQRVKLWIDAHPHKAELLAVLVEDGD